MSRSLLAASAIFVLALAPLARAETPFAPVPAETVDLAAMKWQKRPIVVFADTPADPAFAQQMADLADMWPALAARDVEIITDTDPDARTDVRRTLRPVGFAVVLMDKDGTVVLRKPSPRSGREIISTIDRLPLRREEQRRESGGRETGS